MASRMIRSRYFLLGLLVAFGVPALAVGAFSLFKPATGILKGNINTYVTTAAVSADIVGLFSGGDGCTGVNLLAADGTCRTGGGGGGGVTSVGLTVPAGFSVTGSPVTASGTLAVTRVAGAAGFAYTALPSAVNLTTEGVMDWLLVGSTTTVMPDLSQNFSAAGAVSRKLLGGQQIRYFGVGGDVAFSAGGAFPTVTWSASAGDVRAFNAGFSGALGTLAFITGANNKGIVFSLPCDPYQRVVRIYASNGAPYDVRVLSSDSSISTTNTRATGGSDQITITYTCTYPGQTVTVYVGNDSSHTNNISIGAVTLAPT